MAQWNGAALPTTVISSTQLDVTLPAANLAAVGSFAISAVNPGLEAAPSNTLVFNVTNPVPTIAQLSLAGTTLTVTGGSFASGATVLVGGTEYAAAGDGTQLHATLSAEDVATADGTEITVYNPGPGGGVSNIAALSLGTTPHHTHHADGTEQAVFAATRQVTYAGGAQLIVAPPVCLYLDCETVSLKRSQVCTILFVV